MQLKSRGLFSRRTRVSAKTRLRKSRIGRAKSSLERNQLEMLGQTERPRCSLGKGVEREIALEQWAYFERQVSVGIRRKSEVA